MRCDRCQGLMVEDHLIDMLDDSGNLWLRTSRCVSCGAVSEPLIDRRRRGTVAVVRPLTRRSVRKPRQPVGGVVALTA